jgi:hypothetical protein
MRSLKDILRTFVHSLALPTVVWALAITSITYFADAIRLPEAAASALVPVLETKIFVKSDERPGFEYAAFDVPEAKQTILKAVNGATTGASPRPGVSKAQKSR